MNAIHDRPNVIVSKCLGFDHCRWNGETIRDEHVEALKPLVDFSPVCPEVEIGMGVPRNPIRLVEQKGRLNLVQPTTSLDYSGKMAAFCERYLDGQSEVDGFILKNRSPSCGPVDVRIYSGIEKGAASYRGSGAFGGRVRDSFSHLAVEHEGRLKNFTLREHFFTKLFTLASFRRIRTEGTMKALIGFHSINKLLFMAYNQSQARLLGRFVANARHIPVQKVFILYEATLPKVLARPIAFTAGINALMHALGYFSKELTRDEKGHFLETLEHYREGIVPLSSLLTLLTSWIVRFKEPYLSTQTLFTPFPRQLVEITDSGKGR